MAASASQMRAIPEGLVKSKLLRALGIEPQPEWVSKVFIINEPERIYLEVTDDGVIHHRGFASSLIHINDVIKATKSPPSTPTGDALRVWLRRWGWLPKKERDVMAAQQNTKTII